MCGGSKGQSSTQQSQTYAPNPAATGAISGAIGQAQNTASLPFNIPQAPVAGFSPDQMQAFQGVRNAQGTAQPYINQANNYFQQSAAGPDISQFFNPYASAVTSQLNNTFGQQTSQNNANLVQAAGGVGADRIGVGQANLANQQGLAAGQTLANLYAPSLSAGLQEQNVLQGAGYGTAALGQSAQNSALQGSQALLGTGGLQQQLQQAQLNSPYQQAVAQAAFPYQQSQFLTNSIASLAPGLGGTTYGQGTSTPAQPSIWSQILGGAGVGTALLGGSGVFGGSGKGSGFNPFTGSAAYGGGNVYSGDQYGGSSSNPLPGLSPGDYGAGFARGGTIDLPQRADGSYGYDDGGTVSDRPIDIAPSSIIPTGQMAKIAPHIPQVNLSPPAAQQQQSAGPGIGDIAKLAMMFAANGGAVPREKMRTFDGHNPYAFFAAGGTADDDVINPDEPYRLAGQAAMDDWRSGADSAMAFAPKASTPAALPRAVTSGAPASPAPEGLSPSSAPAPASAEATPSRDPGFAGSPWAALLSAGLGAMAGTSPFAGVNIGQGGLQGLKTLEQQRQDTQKDTTIEQAAKRLAQEAKFHEDQYARMTPYQKAQVDLHKDAAEFQRMQPVKVGTDALGRDIMARKDPKSGQYINIMTGKPVEDTTIQGAPNYQVPGPQSQNEETEIPKHAQYVSGVTAPEGVDPTVLAQFPAGFANKVRAVDEGRMSITQIPMKERTAVQNALNQYDPQFDGSVWGVRNAQQKEMSTNGNAGKMILAVNQLLPHLKTASDKAADLDNSDYPAANTIANFWATQTGDPRVKKFETVREVAAMDAARLLRGSGQMAEEDINFWRKTLGAAGSPAQLQETLKLLADDLMGARISSIQHSYRMNMRMEPPDFVSKEAKEALETIKKRGAPAAEPPINPPAATGAPAPQPTAGQPPAAPPAATAAPPAPGARQAPDGHWYIQKDGQYYRVDH